jgi:hypothetical protein
MSAFTGKLRFNFRAPLTPRIGRRPFNKLCGERPLPRIFRWRVAGVPGPPLRRGALRCTYFESTKWGGGCDGA